jgi:hypothetical protein
MAIKIRLPNGRFINVDTDDQAVAQKTAAQYYNSGETGFIDDRTRTMANESDKNNFDYESGVNAPWLRVKLGAAETQGEKERILEQAVGGQGFTRNSRGDLALTPDGLKKLKIKPTSNKYVVIDESGFSWNDFSDFSGIIGPVVGSIAGSIFTRGKLKPKFAGLKNISVGQLGVVSAGTGVGAAGGKAIEESLEYVAGLQENTPGELAELLATEAAIGAGGEALFGLGGKLLKYTFGQKALSKGELGAKDLRMAAAMSDTGIVDSLTGKRYKGAVALAAMDSPLSGLAQGITETVSQYQKRKLGVRDLLITDAKNLLRSTNSLTADFNQEIDDIIKSGFGSSTQDVVTGKKIAGSISRAFDQSKKNLNISNNNVRKLMDGILEDFDAFTLPATSQAGEQIRQLTAEGFEAWYSTQSKLYDSTGRFFEIPSNISPQSLSFKAFQGPGLGKQAEFIDSTPLKDFINNIVKNYVDATGKLDPLKAGPQLADFQQLINKTNKNLSLKELLELRSGLTSANRITDQSGAFGSIASPDRSKLISIIDETLERLENGDEIAFNNLKEFFESNLNKSEDFVAKAPALKESYKSLDGDIFETLQEGFDQSAGGIIPDSKTELLLKYQSKPVADEINKRLKSIAVKRYDQSIKNTRMKEYRGKAYDQDINSDVLDNNWERAAEMEDAVLDLELKIAEETQALKTLVDGPSFNTPAKLIKQLELDEAYNKKVVDDIINNKKIDPVKLQAQIDSIRIANSFYSKGKDAFSQATYTKTLNDAAAGGYDLDKILTNVILQKNNGDDIARWLNTLDVDTAALRKVRAKDSGRVDRSKAPIRSELAFSKEELGILDAADIDAGSPVFRNKQQVIGILQKEFLRTITNQIQKGSGVVNYRQIANTIDGYGTTGDALFGASKKRELVKTLREADDFVNVGTADELEDLIVGSSNVDKVIDDLNIKIAAQSELDEIAKIDVFKKIQNGTIDSENIVKSLFKAGNSEEIATVKRLLGPDSVEFKEFQTSAMRKILNDYVNPGDDAIEVLFKEGKFYDAIMSPNGYGQAVLKETFGDAQYQSLKEAASRSKFLAGGEKISGGGDLFTRGLMFRILSAPFQTLPQYGGLRTVAMLLGSKRFTAWLAGKIPDKVFLKNDLPNLYQTIGINLQDTPFIGQSLPDFDLTPFIGQQTRRALGAQTATQPFRSANEMGQRRYKEGFIDPKSPIGLELPEVQNFNPPGQIQQGPVSPSLITDPITRALADALRGG